MNRITFEGNFCDIAHCFLPEETCWETGMCSQRRAWERLKHYEDLQEQGRLVELPCKIGDSVYCVRAETREIVVDKVSDFDVWSIRQGVKMRLTLQTHNDYVVGEFGKTVFLNLEEAEAAMKGAEAQCD